MKKVLVFICCLLLVSGCGNNKAEEKGKKLESNLTSMVSLYYQENIVGQFYPPFTCTKITIKEMKDAGVDVSEFEKAGCDASSVAAVVTVTDYSNPSDIKFQITPTLSCKDFSSTISEETKSTNKCLGN